jgi:ADP-ribose pyrophosphatase
MHNTNARLDEYLHLAVTKPDLFASPPGSVRILLNPADIREVEKAIGQDLVARGQRPDGAQVGIVFNDPWFYVLRDAVEFPDGARRTHARVINRTGNGAAALPMLGNHLVLLRHFRHAVRRWSLEIPRGAIEPGDSAEDTARTEIKEEIGGRVLGLTPLAFVHGTTNLYSSGAHLFFAKLESVGEPQLGEGIAAIEQYTVPEFEDLLLQGKIVDSFTVAAYTHAKLRGLL